MRDAEMEPVVRMADPARDYQALKGALETAVLGVLASGQYVQGNEVRALEQNLAATCAVRHAVTTASGTMALLIGLRAAGIGPGDEVITSPYTSICTTSAITHAGATIRFADIEPHTLTLDPARAEAALTPRTAALLPVHLHGQLADMEAFNALAARHGLRIFEDAALALGARYRGLPAGSLSTASAISFAPSKVLGGIGWGGVMLTDDAALEHRARQLAAFGPPPDAEGSALDLEGYNAQMNAMQAAGLRVKLAGLAVGLARRRAIADQYAAACDRLGLRRLHPPAHVVPAWRTFVILVPQREVALNYLTSLGIEASAHFVPALHLRPVYRRLGYRRGDFPVAEEVTDQLICLPLHARLSADEVERVVAALAGLPA